MRFVDEFRDPVLAKRALDRVESLLDELGATPEAPIKIMEVCGGHTHTIFKFGLEELLPDSLELVHGPGCPVCVLPIGRVDDAIAIAEQGVIFCTYGDAIRVPGSKKSLLQAKAEGCDVRTVYSPMDALAIARKNPDREVVFFGLGFETTVPSSALTVQAAAKAGVDNFSIFSNHITIVPTLQAILGDDLQLQGFVGPGHVTMVIGLEPYAFIAEEHRLPFVVSGFEPLDMLQSIVMVLEQLVAGEPKVENQYARVVASEGNRVALAAIDDVFQVRPHFEWRGLGSIPRSGLTLTEKYARFDAEKRFAVPHLSVADPRACQCGQVLKGAIKPWQCKVFGTACTPETPIGACMVSSEGSCAAYYSYGRLSTTRHLERAR